ncbi:uncharacterized protein LOC117116658 [Anneissia japonica]|uniref:uncharacterized protein LOC117116658 n=1 Tax=Anneissia japonica TaxID=1529436 RepID=UPI00142583B1|nr:uncharacterized protein LOC117116658 [Anneissia japonica]
MSCGINGCQSDHNRLLHRTRNNDKRVGNSKVPIEGERTSTGGQTNKPITMLNQSHSVALRTIPIIVSKGCKHMQVNALLDDGSTQRYINTDLCGELGLHGESEEIVVSLLNGKEERFITRPVTFSVSSVDNRSRKYTLDALTTNNVTGKLEHPEWNRISKDWDHLKGIEFPVINTKRQVVDILIGVDHPQLHTALEERHGKPGEPIARRTPLGWTCVGRVNKASRATLLHAKTYKSNVLSLQETEEVMRKFWEVENEGLIKSDVKLYTKEEELAVKVVTESMCSNGERYQVKVPWKEDEKKEMPKTNYEMAEKRLTNLEKRLKKDTVLGAAYQEVVDSYREKEYIRKVNPEEKHNLEQQWFLPHFPVVKLDRETTKVRVVYDASASYRGVSLNDVIHNGPKLQNNLFDVLLRFRRNSVAVVCDISEMYLQIELANEDKQMFRFLWRDLDESKEPEVYEFNRLVFGVNVAPFISQKVAQENAKLLERWYPLAAETVLMSTYMDDSMDSVNDVKTAVELYNQLMELWGMAGMKARKWLSNSKEVLEAIPEDQRAKELKLNESELPSVKTLGLMWKAESDVFVFRGPGGSIENMTKRNILSKIATLFDPLGFISPVIISAKIMLQELWTLGVSWDELVPQNVANGVADWLSGLQNLQKLEVPRCIKFTADKDQKIHTFVDASNDAYAAVVYLRSSDGEQKTVRLIASKTRDIMVATQAISKDRPDAEITIVNPPLYKRFKTEVNSRSDRVLIFVDNNQKVVETPRFG